MHSTHKDHSLDVVLVSEKKNSNLQRKTMPPAAEADAASKWREEKAEDEKRAAWATTKPVQGKDKNITKIGKLQNRLKKFTAADLESLKKELGQLDLTKYASELGESMLESVQTGTFKVGRFIEFF